VQAYFAELQIPIVTSTMNIPFVRSLEFQAAYRYEDFDNKDQFTNRTSTFNNNGDVRFTLRYQPTDWITMRASFGESFLSPSPGQLFSPVQENFPQLFDPATGRVLQPPEGVQQGGNTTLRPETTETYAAGIVLTPKFIPGLTVTADLYQLFTRNVILPSSDFASIVLTQNGNFFVGNPGANPAAAPFGAPFNAAFSDDPNAPTRVFREEGTLTPLRIEGANTQNAGKRLVNGLDVTAVYQLPWTTYGTFTISLGYNYFFTWKAEAAPGEGTNNFLGDYNNGTLPLAPGAIPRHKGFLRGEYEWKGFTFVATTNYISSFYDDPAFINADFVAARGTDLRRVSDYITLDMQLRYEFVKPEMEAVEAGYAKDAKSGKSIQTSVAGVEQGSFFQRMLWGTSVRVGVVNAFDRNPPTVIGAFNDNYDTSLYSIRNRYYYVGFNKKF